MRKSQIEIHEQRPDSFHPQVEVAACYWEIDGRLLVLKRSPGKEGGCWGVPAGKIEGNETIEAGARRELGEETRIWLEHASQLQFLFSLYIRKPDVDYVYHLFRVYLDEMPKICLSHEHTDYKWATAQELERLPLMVGAREILGKLKSFG